VVQLPDGSNVRGAKRGGVTDHIAGPHLIPNVGREAMVPSEVVRRQPRAKAKPKPKPLEEQRRELLLELTREEKARKKAEKEAAKKARKERKSRSRGSRSRSRRRDRSRSRRRSPSEESASPPRERRRTGIAVPKSPEVEAPPLPPDEPAHPKKTAQEEEEEMRAQARADIEAKEREGRRLEQEKLKLEELEKARQKKRELDKQRRSKLNGMFALDEDDMDEGDEEAKKARAVRERALAEERRHNRDRASSSRALALGSGDDLGSTSMALSSVGASAAGGPPRLVSKEGVTALDIDGKSHESHKFGSVWKDWDANKKDDPGEIARMFMKVSAVKRRGYTAGADRDSRR